MPYIKRVCRSRPEEASPTALPDPAVPAMRRRSGRISMPARSFTSPPLSRVKAFPWPATRAWMTGTRMADRSRGDGALTERFEHALAYACRVHGRQTRKGPDGIPYIGHLLGVASLVVEDGGDEDEAIAALLHDAVEDQGGAPRLADIQARFGKRVATIVEGCTDADTIPKPEWLPRKRRYIRHLRSAPADVLRVSCADKLQNARAILADYRTLADALFSRFNGRKAGTLWYYACLVNVFKSVGPRSLAEELEQVVRELRERAAPGLAWPASEEDASDL